MTTHWSCQGCICRNQLQRWVPTDDALAWPEGACNAAWQIYLPSAGHIINMPLHVLKPLPSLVPQRHQKMAKHPTHQGVPIEIICSKYGATQFLSALSRLIVQYQHPDYSKAQVKVASKLIHIPFSKVSVFHCLKFTSYDAYSLNPLDQIVVDSIHIDPLHFDKYNKAVPGHFDMAIIQFRDSSHDLDLKGTDSNISLRHDFMSFFYF